VRIHTGAQWPVFARTEWLESTIVQIATVDANGIERGKTWANRSRPSSSCHSARRVAAPVDSVHFCSPPVRLPRPKRHALDGHSQAALIFVPV
jgi:hypothetical protein